MDSFELNKIIGAILGTLLFVMGVGFLAEAIYHPIEGRGPGYPLPVPEGTEVAEAAVEAEPAVPLGLRLASASAEQGATAARKCQSCHNFEQGTGNKQGPILYDTVGRIIGSVEGFNYSEIMVSHREAGDVWTYAALDAFLQSPSDYMPGTKMNFAGVRSDEERANILAYMGSLSESPEPFPPADIPPAEAPIDGEPADVIPEGIEAAPESTEAVETEADAVATPTETQGEDPVVGTPVSETVPGETPPEEPPAESRTTPDAEPAEGADTAPENQMLTAPSID
ncbi:MAG TPA: cytochrome c family protein [Devosiaceae bacterium]|jgi:cytochrome c|nr:cytochrome c family protein [Devosiaceae bacterium]